MLFLTFFNKTNYLLYSIEIIINLKIVNLYRSKLLYISGLFEFWCI